jgi:hypothetical protein
LDFKSHKKLIFIETESRFVSCFVGFKSYWNLKITETESRFQ